nr:MAG TPA: LAMBDA REPRESSOR (TRIPLE MUTANT)/DNA COMPLEX-DNA COMPLEX, DOUBLE HELIX, TRANSCRIPTION-DNA.1A [Caudoviricetes sp.]
MRIKQEVKKIIHQNIEEYALKVNKSSSTVKRWLYTDNKQFRKRKHAQILSKVIGLTEDQIFESESNEI